MKLIEKLAKEYASRFPPYYMVGQAESFEAGFRKAIEMAEKAIDSHSLRAHKFEISQARACMARELMGVIAQLGEQEAQRSTSELTRN